MKSALLSAVAAIALAQAAPAHAALQHIYGYGSWEVYGGTDANNQQVCGINSAGADGRRLTIQQISGNANLQIDLTKPSWNIPANTPVDISFQYDSTMNWPAHGTGSADTIHIDIAYDNAAAFEHDFRIGQTMRIFFPNGNEPQWTGSLAGTNAVFRAFDQCRINLNVQPTTSAAATQPVGATPTQPVAAPAQAATTQPAAPTQPMAASAPAQPAAAPAVAAPPAAAATPAAPATQPAPAAAATTKTP